MGLPDVVRAQPLHDLAALPEVLGQSTVVAIGENSHYIREFALLRSRLLRLLVTELGFEVIAFESGFAEGQLVDEWVRGGPGEVEEVAREGFTFRFGDAPEMHDMLRWVRAHNAAGGRVRFAGLDVPGSGGSAEPALRRVREYLAAHAPAEVAMVDDAIEACRPYAAANNGVAPARYAGLRPAARDVATAALARLMLRLDALAPGPDPQALGIARHHALGALRLDEQLREILAFSGPNLPALAVSSRDVYQAETIRLLRRLHGPEVRIVLMLHNAHAQRVPMQLVPGTRARTVGCYLAYELGTDYLAIGVTALTGETADARLDERSAQGIELFARRLDPPAEDSVERAVADSGAVDEPVLLDLRPARGTASPSSIRHVTTHLPVDVAAAFDLLICLPEMHPSSIAHPPKPGAHDEPS